MKILVTPTSMAGGSSSPAMERLRAFADEIVFNPTGRPLTPEELLPLLRGCQGYIAGLDQITAQVLEGCPDLRVVSRYGAGCDAVDIASARRLGITVTNTPGVNAQGVAELAMGLILSAARKLPALDHATKSGRWVRSTGVELCGRTVGIVGLGAIGKRLAKCCAGFGMALTACDPQIDPAYCRENGIEPLSFSELLRRADVISLHLPLNDQTRHIIGREAIAQMRDGAIVVNTSRGAIVDEDAAYEALVSGKLGGLGLDAFEVEPPVNCRLMTLDNVVTTPHTGAHTIEAIRNMQECAVDNLIAVLSGHPCRNIVS